MLPSCAFARGAAANDNAAATNAATVTVFSHVLAHCFMLASPFACVPLPRPSFARGSLRRTFWGGPQVAPYYLLIRAGFQPRLFRQLEFPTHLPAPSSYRES